MDGVEIVRESFLTVDRYIRLFRFYLLGQHKVRRIWAYPGKLNQMRLSDPGDILKGYFLDFSHDADYLGPIDAEGVPLVDYGGLIGIKHNPWAIGHYALANYQRFAQTGNEAYCERFLKCAQWFVKHGEHRATKDVVWSYDFSLRYPKTKPWISCLAQGYGISVLSIAYALQADGNYLLVADKAFQALKRPTQQGGCAMHGDDGTIVFQEDSSLTIPHVLNGWIFALFGVYDYAVVTRDDNVWELWNHGVRSLQKYLPLYDCGFFSLYNLDPKTRLKNTASVFYHKVHVLQLEVLKYLTGEDVFDHYATRWKRFANSWLCKLCAMVHKIIFKALRY